MTSKFQHLVLYVEDLKRSKEFYMNVFDLQFSALNHPDSSAAMKLSSQEMHFFSFGFYHHDICLVKHHKLKMDNNSMLHYTMVVKDQTAFEKVLSNAIQLGVEVKNERLLKSAKMGPGWKALSFRDPDNHWIEILVK